MVQFYIVFLEMFYSKKIVKVYHILFSTILNDTFSISDYSVVLHDCFGKHRQ